MRGAIAMQHGQPPRRARVLLSLTVSGSRQISSTPQILQPEQGRAHTRHGDTRTEYDVQVGSMYCNCNRSLSSVGPLHVGRLLCTCGPTPAKSGVNYLQRASCRDSFLR